MECSECPNLFDGNGGRSAGRSVGRSDDEDGCGGSGAERCVLRARGSASSRGFTHLCGQVHLSSSSSAARRPRPPSPFGGATATMLRQHGSSSDFFLPCFALLPLRMWSVREAASEASARARQDSTQERSLLRRQSVLPSVRPSVARQFH